MFYDVADPEVPPRLPDNKGGIGTVGTPVSLLTNYFPLKFGDMKKSIHHFDLTIKKVTIKYMISEYEKK